MTAYLALAVLGLAPADTPALRALVIDADLVVLAVRAPAGPPRFRVVEVLRGKGVRVGDVVAPRGLEARHLRTWVRPVPPSKEPTPRRLRQALLFLRKGGQELLPCGLRFCGEDDTVFFAAAPPRSSHAPFELREQRDVNWSVEVYQARAAAVEVERLLALGRLARPQRRWQALRGWVEQRRGEFGSALSTGRGWGKLERQVFDWMLQAGDPDERWATVQLYAEVHHGELLCCPAAFAWPAGRARLCRVLTDDRALAGDRVRALRLLGEPATLWPEQARGAAVLTTAEQEKLLDLLAGFLAVPDEATRTAAARAVLSASRPGRPDLAGRVSRRALPALVAAYKEAKPGPARDQLALAVCALAAPEQWKELSGNPPGVVGLLRDPSRLEGQLWFWLELHTSGSAVHEAPTLVLERIGPLGFVAETQRFPLPPGNLGRPWAAGWDGRQLLVVTVPLGKLQPGNWRFRVEGTLGKGKDKQPWAAERKQFTIAAPTQKTPGRRSRGKR
jgi:hypothetical protein